MRFQKSLIWGFNVGFSLFLISLFCYIFLDFKTLIFEIETFRKMLMFSIAIILIILQYGFSYERLLKYHFTEWWRRTWRPYAMISSILLILVIGAKDPEPAINKVCWLFLALVLVFLSPWIIRKIIVRSFSLPNSQAMVLIKAKTDKESLKNVVEKVDKMDGVYKRMVVKGEYDVCLLVEGVNNNDIIKKIFEIRNEDGNIISTTTLTDISEFFDMEVKYES